jgi:hypothetical protein
MREIVIHQHIGLGNEFAGAKRDKTQIAGTCAYKINLTGG